MTLESVEMVEAVDGLPQWVRARLLRSVLSAAMIYAAAASDEAIPISVAKADAEPGGVISLCDRRKAR